MVLTRSRVRPEPWTAALVRFARRDPPPLSALARSHYAILDAPLAHTMVSPVLSCNTPAQFDVCDSANVWYVRTLLVFGPFRFVPRDVRRLSARRAFQGP